MKSYQQEIKERIAKMGYIGKYEPRHIEAFMRSAHSTLDGLSSTQFNNEIKIAMMCIDDGGKNFAERIALSYGL